MLNLKNNENDAVFNEIQKKNSKIKIKFQKMKGTFMDSIPWLKSHQQPLMYMYICIKTRQSHWFLFIKHFNTTILGPQKSSKEKILHKVNNKGKFFTP